MASKGGKADYYGITYEKIDAQQGVFWPCPTLESQGTPRLFEEQLLPPRRQGPLPRPRTTNPPAELPDAEYPFFYTTGRVIFHYLSGNQTRRIGALVENAPEPYVEIHPLAAEKLGVDSGDSCACAAGAARYSCPRKSRAPSGPIPSLSPITGAASRRPTC